MGAALSKQIALYRNNDQLLRQRNSWKSISYLLKPNLNRPSLLYSKLILYFHLRSPFAVLSSSKRGSQPRLCVAVKRRCGWTRMKSTKSPTQTQVSFGNWFRMEQAHSVLFATLWNSSICSLARVTWSNSALSRISIIFLAAFTELEFVS